MIFFISNNFRQGLIHIFFLAGSSQEETFTPAPTLGAGTSATKHTRQYSLWNSLKQFKSSFPKDKALSALGFGLKSSGVFTLYDENLVLTRGTYFVHYFLSWFAPSGLVLSFLTSPKRFFVSSSAGLWPMVFSRVGRSFKLMAPTYKSVAVEASPVFQQVPPSYLS